ncbi:MAG: hypothetical protein V4858_08865 [Pseudomonadota bacterium]
MISSVLRMPSLYLAGAAMVAAASVGWTVGRAPLLTQLAQQDGAHTREKLRSFERAAEVLQDANDRGDQLITALELRQADINQLAREKRDAITKVTTGRTCLGESALRLLNSAPGLSVSGLAPAVSGTVAAGTAAAPDSVVSSDTEVATWIVDAGAQYEVCRTRLNALIDWHLQPAPPATPANQHP